MIQRIQTLFLIAIPILLGIMQFLPVFSIEDTRTLHNSYLFLWFNKDVYLVDPVMKDNIIVNEVIDKISFGSMPYQKVCGILTIFMNILAIYTICQYKHRMLQVKLITLNNVIAASLLGIITYFSTKHPLSYPINNPKFYCIGFYIPILVVVCNLLAKHFIQQDDKLIRSINRLR